MGSIVLLDLMGGVALLLWGLHMVLSGVLRAFGPDLRRLLGKALGNRFTAFGAGLGLTAFAAIEHRYRPNDRVARGRRRGEPRPSACHHARRQCRHHADRAASVFRYRRDRTGPVHYRPFVFRVRRYRASPAPSAASPLDSG